MKRIVVLFAVLAAALGLNACGGGNVKLNGAGASFPAPLYAKMFDVYKQKKGVTVNYESVGSGTGIKYITEKTVDFGASDAPMSDKALEALGVPVIHVPMALGAVVIAYNLPGNLELKLDSQAVADIFLGKITKWNDPRLAALNPGVNLPATTITVVHRSDGSGTTFAFTDYLTRANAEWAQKVGTDKAVKWPVGIGGNKNEGVAANVLANEGAIGYMELSYALQNKISMATIKNKSGNFIKPTIEGVSQAAAGDLPPHTRVSIADTDAPNGYPISSFTWIIIYQEQKYDGRSLANAQALVNLLNWMIHEGQTINATLDYAPIPEGAVQKAEALLKSVTFDGKPILQ